MFCCGLTGSLLELLLCCYARAPSINIIMHTCQFVSYHAHCDTVAGLLYIVMRSTIPPDALHSNNSMSPQGIGSHQSSFHTAVMSAPFRMYPKCDVPPEYLVPPTPQMLEMAAFEHGADQDEVVFLPVLLVPSCQAAKDYWIWHHAQPLEQQMNHCIVSLVSLITYADRIGLAPNEDGAKLAEKSWIEELKTHGCATHFFLMSFRKSEVAELYREEHP